MDTAIHLNAQHHAQSAPAEKIKVNIKDLSFYYGATKSLKNITLPLYERRVTAFIGPSGCGKSTLLRVLARIYDLYPGQRAPGQVLLAGHNIQQAARTSQHTAFMYLGELVEFGPTDAIFLNPRERRTQDYITGRFG